VLIMPKIKEVYNDITTTAAIIHEEQSLEAARKKLMENPISRVVYVVNKENQLTGIISIKDILRAIGIKEGIVLNRISLKTLYQFVSKKTVVKDVMHPPISITLDKRFLEAIQMMLSHGYEEIAVVDNEGKVIGDLNAFEIINNMKIEIDKREEF